MRVLVVDDNPDIRLLVRMALLESGISTSEVEGGPEALAMLESSEPPDVIVLDVQMPDVDGWDTLRAIRHNPATARIPVLLCTVKGGLQDEVMGWELGCDGYLAKPFRLADLSSKVRAVLESTPHERERIRASRLEDARRELDALTTT